MRVVRPQDSLGTVKLITVKQGETFRLPESKNCNTVWMVTANDSDRPEDVNQVRTVALTAGTVAYKSPNLDVVPVKGRFIVDDWGRE